jgi:hypothetical protein
MKHIIPFVDNDIYILDQYPKVVGKLNIAGNSKYVIGYYIDDKYYYINYKDGASKHIIYKPEWLRFATEEEIDIYNEFDEISNSTKSYNL